MIIIYYLKIINKNSRISSKILRKYTQKYFYYQKDLILRSHHIEMSLKAYSLVPSELIKEITQENRELIKKQFDQLDENGDGHLDLSELAKLLIAYKIDPAFGALAIRLCDVDGDGTITFDEYANFILLFSKLSEDPSILYRNMFDYFDDDKSGTLEGDEIKQFVKYFTSGELPEEKYNKLFKAIDTDGDGKLDFDEVCRFLDIITEK